MKDQKNQLRQEKEHDPHLAVRRRPQEAPQLLPSAGGNVARSFNIESSL